MPSLILPYCWDGHDNARRAVDCGAGRMLHRWDWTPEALGAAVEGLLADTGMQERLRENGAFMRAQGHVRLAAERILALVAGR